MHPLIPQPRGARPGCSRRDSHTAAAHSIRSAGRAAAFASLCITTTLALAACSPEDDSAAELGAAAAEGMRDGFQAAPEAGAEATAQADADAIREIDRRWVEMVAADDTIGIANLYTADARLMPPGAPVVRGRDAIRHAWAGIVQLPLVTFEPQVIHVSESGDMAYDIGTVRLEVPGENAGTVEVEGKYVVVWENVDGEWRVVADIFNNDTPPGS